MSHHDKMSDSHSELKRRKNALARRVGALFDELPADPQAVRELEDLLRWDDVALREFVEIADMDARLRWMHRGANSVRPKHDVAVHEPIFHRVRRSPVTAVVIAVSIMLVLASGYAFHTDRAIARLTEVAGVKWGDPDVTWKKGSRIGAEPVNLLEGVIEITLRNDTRLIVEGPALLNIRSDMEAFLENGTVSVFVGKSVDGYALDSPDVRVVDVGTAFQVNTSLVGTEVHVVDGQVMAYPREVPGDGEFEETSLIERQAVRINRQDGSMQEIPFAGGRMNLRGRGTPLTAIPIAVTGAIRCLELPPESVAVGALEDTNSMQLFLECSGYTLSRPLFADRNSKGQTAADLGGNHGLEIPRGTRVNNYLLHYDPENDDRDDTLHRVSGTIEFRTPILGVFYSNTGLYTSDKYFCSEETEYVSESQLLSPRCFEDLDFVSFSPDRRTLIVNLQANTTADQLRIVTMEDDLR